MPNDHTTIRLLDAALNRASEGLRVVEDYVRFVLDDGHLSTLLKQLRHDLTQTAVLALDADRHNARDTPGDVGTKISTANEARRTDLWNVCVASCERTKQSLRSLEEFSKLGRPKAAAQFETLRYRFYAIESAVVRTVRAIDQLADVRLYVLIDGRPSPEAFASLVDQLVEAGADAIQLRDKRLSDRELLDRAKTLVRITRAAAKTSYRIKALPSGERPGEGQHRRWASPSPNPTLKGRRTGEAGSRAAIAEEFNHAELPAKHTLAIINDRADVAAAANADGVHLGQGDLDVADARKVVGPHKLIGMSTHSLEQARTAVRDGANYLGVGPTFPSATKSFDDFPGLDLLQQVADEIALPAFAIGGITATNLAEVLATGAKRAAVSGAVAAAEDAAAAVRVLVNLLR